MYSPRADRAVLALSIALGLVGAAPAAAAAQEAPATTPQPLSEAPASPPAAGVISAHVRAEGGRDAARLAITWPKRVKTEVERNGDELVLRFDVPLGDVALDRVPTRLPGWVDNVLYGYDSVLLMVAPTADAAVRPSANGVEVAFTPNAKGSKAAPEAEILPVAPVTRFDPAAPEPAPTDPRAADARRLDYLRAVVMMEAGKVRQARALLRELVTLDPKDVQSTVLLANAEERLGRWRDAVRLLNRALELTPGEVNLIRNKRNLINAAGQGVRVDHDVNAVRNADTQRIERVSARRLVAGDGMIDFMMEYRHMDIDQVTRPDGEVKPFHGLRRTGAVTYVKEWRELQASHFSVFFSDRNLGAGYRHVWRRDLGALEFGAAWREPNNTFVEGVSDGGWRSRVHLGVSGELAKGWLYDLTAGINGYGLDDTDRLTSSATVSGSLVHVLSAVDPYIAVAYTLDAEYVIDSRFRTAASGLAFHPVSVGSREVHGLQLSFERGVTDYLRYGWVGGYSWDRRAKGAPFASLSLTYAPLDDLEMGLRASHARATSRGTADMVNSAGGYLLLRY